MIYLIFGIFTNAAIFLVFRAFSIFKIDNMQAIVVNYLFCVITALIFVENPAVLTSVNYFDSWSLVAAFIGFLLVIGFYAASLTSQLLGVSVVSVASKMSMMFPVLFSLFFMKIATKSFTLYNYTGMLLAVIAIYLSSVKRNSGESKSLHGKRYLMLLPFTVFLAGGFIDIGLNYSNHRLITDENVGVYTVVLFAGAAVSGIFSLFFQKGKFQLKNLIGGVVLGICNYFSLFFVLKALTAFENNGAVFYPVYNVGIIMVSSFTAMILFKEKLSKTNFIGLTMAVLALFLLSYQDILDYFIV